jgi:hypothetical protein
MIVVDNRQYLFDSIERSIESQVGLLEEEARHRLDALRERMESELDAELSEMAERHAKEKEREERQKRSGFELRLMKESLVGRDEVFGRIMKALETRMSGKGADARKVYEAMVARIDANAGKRVKSLRTPVGVKLKGRKCTDNLRERKLVAAEGGCEVEYGLSDLLREKMTDVNRVIAERLG